MQTAVVVAGKLAFTFTVCVHGRQDRAVICRAMAVTGAGKVFQGRQDALQIDNPIFNIPDLVLGQQLDLFFGRPRTMTQGQQLLDFIEGKAQSFGPFDKFQPQNTFPGTNDNWIPFCPEAAANRSARKSVWCRWKLRRHLSICQ